MGIVGVDHERESIKQKKNVLSLEMARKRARQPKGASDRQISKGSNQRLVEQLKVENAQLRALVVDLMLQIQAFRDGAR